MHEKCRGQVGSMSDRHLNVHCNHTSRPNATSESNSNTIGYMPNVAKREEACHVFGRSHPGHKYGSQSAIMSKFNYITMNKDLQ